MSGKFPDLYKLPPMEFQSYDEWQKETQVTQEEEEEEEDERMGVDIPEPDYHDNEGNSPTGSPSARQRIFMPTEGNEELMIGPKKLHNPNLESHEKQDLHRELMMNYKRGVDVLDQKSELKKKLEHRRDVMKRKEQEEYMKSKRTSFEILLEQQAQKLNEQKLTEKPIAEVSNSKPDFTEFLKIHSKIRKNQSGSIHSDDS